MITYTTDGVEGRNEVRPYKHSPDARRLDIVMPNANDIRNIPADKTAAYSNGLLRSKYAIGFEVEKSTFNQIELREFALFKGFEMDGSCGVEAITNVLPLLPRSVWRMKVFNMMVEADDVLCDSKSPTNDRCGGHMHLSVDGMQPYELLQRIRKYSGILYALYRYRLVNQYCRFDLFMDNSNMEIGIGTYNDLKYRVCKTNAYGIEFRLPSRITSTKQLMRRYEMAYLMVDAAVTDMPMAQFYREAKKIVLTMYDGDAAKTKEMMVLAKHFQKMIDERKINRHVVSWVEGHRNYSYRGRLQRYYDAGCTRYVRNLE